MTASLRTGNEYPIPETEKSVPEPGPAAVLVRTDAVAISATDREIIRHGLPASIEGELPTALRYARDRVEDAIKVVVKMREI
jgi:threonine dehydrogenase-like Zn-dependent dehydrogenase